MIAVTVRHNIEVAHRLLTLEGKCHGLHGHSMWVEVEVTGHRDIDGMVVEFGEWKTLVRRLLDTKYDHGVLLHHADPLVDALAGDAKIATIDNGNPTTENIAAQLARELIPRLHDTSALYELHGVPLSLSRVTVHETAVNAAEWRAE